jgi:hypothetical protein
MMIGDDEILDVGFDLPTALSCSVMHCADRSHAHLVLFDDGGAPMAQLIVGRDLLDLIISESEDLFASPRVQ